MSRRSRKEIAATILERYQQTERRLEERLRSAEARVSDAELARDRLMARLARAREKTAAQRRRAAGL